MIFVPAALDDAARPAPELLVVKAGLRHDLAAIAEHRALEALWM